MSDSNEFLGNVVEMTAFRGARVRPTIGRIEAHWEFVRNKRLVPYRNEIKPSGLQGVLSHVFVIERVSTRLARIRIAGKHLDDLMGVSVKGMPLTALFDPQSRDQVCDCVEAIFDDPAAMRFELNSSRSFGRKALRGDMVLLPLRSDLGDISRALGGVIMDGDIGRAPRKFEIVTHAHRGLTGIAGDPLPEANPKLPGQLIQPVVRRNSSPQSSNGHLKLVHDAGSAALEK